jgi:S-adenosylmethionine:tRNA ribosyltransferase-isomerase
MRTDELDFELPPELIAQVPPPQRGDSRLLHYRRADRSIAHRTFSDLPNLLRSGDLLVFNDARVLPARFMLVKATGGKVEGLHLSESSPGHWRVMLKNAGNYTGTFSFAADASISARIARVVGGGEYDIELNRPIPASELLERIGRMPLPPYIRRDKDRDERDNLDRSRYQTVFARKNVAIAAPTASLHFSDSILGSLKSRGVQSTFVTLHVGMGTFKPVTADDLDAHEMHSERYSIDATAAGAISRAKREHRRVIAVGTTAARVLESQPGIAPLSQYSGGGLGRGRVTNIEGALSTKQEPPPQPSPGVPGEGEEAAAIVPHEGETRIFIRPPYRWNYVDALITNFHLPRSTLIALVAAMTGLDEQRRIYAVAIAERYRFFSYGDAILIE